MKDSAKSRKFKLLSKAEETALAQRWKNAQDREALRELLDAFKPMLNLYARQACRAFPQVSYDDHVQTLNESFIRTLVNFDPEKGRLSTFLRMPLREAIHVNSLHAREQHPRRSPLNNRIKMALNAELARHPEFNPPLRRIFASVAEKMNAPVEKVEEYYLRSRMVASLDAPVGKEKNSSPLGEIIEGETADPLEAIGRRKINMVLEEALSTLDERKQTVLRRRFGLGQMDEQDTLSDLSQTFGVSNERIRQLEIRGLEQLQDFFRHQGYTKAMIIDIFAP